jgi:nitrate reductase molybdenum cofactor assembly chaperone NarJ/NarW
MDDAIREYRRWRTRCARSPGCCATRRRAARWRRSSARRCATRARSQAGRLAELDALLRRLAAAMGLRVEAEYVELFDRGRPHRPAPVRARPRRQPRPRPGDGRPGPDLRARRPAVRPGELPDYLPVVLEFASTQPPAQARLPARDGPHRAGDLQRPAGARQPVRQRAGRRARPRRRARAEASRSPPSRRWTSPGPSPRPSAAAQSRPVAPEREQPVHFVRPPPSAARGRLRNT